MTTQLSMKGSDGQPHPLLQLAIGAPAGGKGLRIVVQVPGDVALRSGIEISLDKGAAGAVVPQEVLLSASYLACTAGGCLADAELGRDVLARLLAAKVANVSFVALTGAKKVMVPVALTGFADAAAALGLPGK